MPVCLLPNLFSNTNRNRVFDKTLFHYIKKNSPPCRCRKSSNNKKSDGYLLEWIWLLLNWPLPLYTVIQKKSLSFYSMKWIAHNWLVSLIINFKMAKNRSSKIDIFARNLWSTNPPVKPKVLQSIRNLTHNHSEFNCIKVQARTS